MIELYFYFTMLYDAFRSLRVPLIYHAETQNFAFLNWHVPGPNYLGGILCEVSVQDPKLMLTKKLTDNRRSGNLSLLDQVTSDSNWSGSQTLD